MKDSNSRGPAWEDWLVDLGRANLSGERRKAHEIMIRWFLGWGWTVFEPWAEVSRSHRAQAQEHRWFSQSLDSPRFPGETAPNVLRRDQPGIEPGEQVLRGLNNQCDIVCTKVTWKCHREIPERIQSRL